MTFIRTTEDFTCEHCGQKVKGDGYTNHCPQCLTSKHVDVEPGDRQSSCGGLMIALATRPLRSGYDVLHQCNVCGTKKINKSHSSDNPSLLIELTAKPFRKD